jgi:hypothetical protein
LAEYALTIGPPSVKTARRRLKLNALHGERGSLSPSHRGVATKVRSCPIRLIAYSDDVGRAFRLKSATHYD